eukprot:4493952-Prymnesium_polylepis.1
MWFWGCGRSNAVDGTCPLWDSASRASRAFRVICLLSVHVWRDPVVARAGPRRRGCEPVGPQWCGYVDGCGCGCGCWCGCGCSGGWALGARSVLFVPSPRGWTKPMAMRHGKHEAADPVTHRSRIGVYRLF